MSHTQISADRGVELTKSFRDLHVMVLGDFYLDRYVYGRVVFVRGSRIKMCRSGFLTIIARSPTSESLLVGVALAAGRPARHRHAAPHKYPTTRTYPTLLLLSQKSSREEAPGRRVSESIGLVNLLCRNKLQLRW